MKKIIIEKDMIKILDSDKSTRIKYIEIVELINKHLSDWTWPEKDTTWGNIEYKEGYNDARKEIISSWKDRFDLND